MPRSILVRSALIVAAVTLGCGSRSPVSRDGGPAADRGAAADGPASIEGAPVTDRGPAPDRPPNTGANSGALCDAATPCPHADDRCIRLAGSSRGMCLSACAKAGAMCHVPDTTSQYSACIMQTPKGAMYCAWICEYQGKHHGCPDSTSYACKASDPKQPAVKLCVPK